jgi:hypothetical protein
MFWLPKQEIFAMNLAYTLVSIKAHRAPDPAPADEPSQDPFDDTSDPHQPPIRTPMNDDPDTDPNPSITRLLH